MFTIVDSIKQISKGEYYRLLWFWHIKNADEDKKWDEDDESRESYERTDNYNVFGLAVFFFLSFKESICKIGKYTLNESTLNYCLVNTFAYSPMSI